MPIRIHPVCKNCRTPIHQGTYLDQWVHTGPAYPDDPRVCHLSVGLAVAMPVITIRKFYP